MLVDTSALVRLANTGDAAWPIADRAVDRLRASGERLCLTPQVLVEFWSVATRPTAVNGLGFDAATAEREASAFEGLFLLLEDVPAIHPLWKNVVATLGVTGKQAHDARLVAVCHAHQVGAVLTFNVGHFTRLAIAPPGLTVLDPRSV